MGKEISKTDILAKKSTTDPLLWAESLNGKPCVDENPEIIIVGTLTPHNYKYFYTSPYNLIYGYIDEARGTKDLTDLKKELNNPSKGRTDEQIIDDIIRYLKGQKIAFLDVMQYAIRKNPTAADSDIEFYNLDVDIFGKIFNSTLKGKEIKVICNSRLAEKKYLSIKSKVFENCGVDILPDCIYISQARRWQNKYKSEWISALK